MSPSSSRCHDIPICPTIATTTPRDPHRTSPRILAWMRGFPRDLYSSQAATLQYEVCPPQGDQAIVLKGLMLGQRSNHEGKEHFSAQRHSPLSKCVPQILSLRGDHLHPTVLPEGLFDLLFIKAKRRPSAVLTDPHTNLTTSENSFSWSTKASAVRTGTRVGNWALPNECQTSANSRIPDLCCYHTKHPKLPLPAHTAVVLAQCPEPLPCQAGRSHTALGKRVSCRRPGDPAS